MRFADGIPTQYAKCCAISAGRRIRDAAGFCSSSAKSLVTLVVQTTAKTGQPTLEV
jgi:hypothetical protein